MWPGLGDATGAGTSASRMISIYEKYGEVRTFFDLFRIYVEEINDPYNWFERLKGLNKRIKHLKSIGDFTSDQYEYFVSLKNSLVSMITDAIVNGEIKEKIAGHTFQAPVKKRLIGPISILCLRKQETGIKLGQACTGKN